MVRVWIAIAVLLGSTTTARATCDVATGLEDLAGALVETDAALSRADAPGFRVAHDRATDAVRCSGETLPVGLVASYHRASGIRSFLDRDVPTAEISFAAARRLRPDFAWPTTLVPEAHPLRTAYAARRTEVPTRDVPEPRRLTLYLDGTQTLARPEGLPVVAQLLDREAAVVWSGPLAPGEPLPALAAPKRGRPGALAFAAVAAAASIGLYVGADRTRATYDDLDTPYQKLDGLRTQVLGLSIGSGAAAGLGSVALIVALVPKA